MKSQIAELSNYQFIKVEGPDFRKFLQGQLSCNMEKLAAEHSLRGAICNLKGRVIADLRVLQLGDGCLLQVDSGMAQPVVATLAKYAVFSKVKLTLLDGHPAPLGLLGAPASQVQQLFAQLPEAIDAVSHGDSASLIRVAGTPPRYELWFHDKAAQLAFSASLPSSLMVNISAWQRAEMQAGVIHVDSSKTETYTPQLLNYDISGVIDFKKGCYTGQEVVARMFYRGSAKKRMYLASTLTPLHNDPGVQQTVANEEKNWEILVCSNAPEGSNEPTLLLTVLDTEAVETGGSFTLAHYPEVKLSILPLHY